MQGTIHHAKGQSAKTPGPLSAHSSATQRLRADSSPLFLLRFPVARFKSQARRRVACLEPGTTSRKGAIRGSNWGDFTSLWGDSREVGGPLRYRFRVAFLTTNNLPVDRKHQPDQHLNSPPTISSSPNTILRTDRTPITTTPHLSPLLHASAPLRENPSSSPSSLFPPSLTSLTPIPRSQNDPTLVIGTWCFVGHWALVISPASLPNLGDCDLFLCWPLSLGHSPLPSVPACLPPAPQHSTNRRRLCVDCVPVMCWFYVGSWSVVCRLCVHCVSVYGRFSTTSRRPYVIPIIYQTSTCENPTPQNRRPTQILRNFSPRITRVC